MKTIFALFLLCLSIPAFAQDTKTTVQLTCDGPGVTKMIAGNFWMISPCNDGKSLVFVASTRNPARPYTITSISQGGQRTFNAQGTGDKAAADAAQKEIEAMTEEQVAAIVAEARAGHQ
jgi:hypothetical protein